MIAAECLEGLWGSMGQSACAPATRPDPRFPRLEDGDEVLCEDCYKAALDEMAEEIENLR